MNSVVFGKALKSFCFTKSLSYIQEAFLKFFMSIYLWRLTGDVSSIVLYTAIHEIAHMGAYFVLGRFGKEHSRFLPLKAGFLLQSVFLLLVILVGSNIVSLIIPVAIIGGFAHGMYWFGDNLLKFDLSNPGNRLKFTGITVVLRQAAFTFVPLFAALLIEREIDVTISYVKLFAISFAIALMGFFSVSMISQKRQ